MNRRQFLEQSSASALWLGVHGLLAGPPVACAGAMPQILGLRLQTAVALPQMKQFYHGTLGLPVLAEEERAITLQAGATRLTFVQAAPDVGKPAYHFAFNIPENKIGAARAWQVERTALIQPYEHLRDARYPDDVVHFRHWNAHSVFFYDPADNVVEYIARHDLANAARGGFSSQDILYASEMGLVVDDVDQVAQGIRETVGWSPYRGGSDRFRAMGDAAGLLLVMKRGGAAAFGQGTPREVFPTEAVLRGTGGSYELPGYPHQLRFA